MILRWFLLMLVLFSLSSCLIKDESPIASSSNEVNLIQRGDIIVTNSANDTIILLDEDGTYKDVLVDADTSAALIFNAVAFDRLNNQVLYSHDSTTAGQDAIKAIALYDGEISTVISNSSLNGTLPGVARLADGELLVIEGTNVLEKFLADGTRSGNPFLSGLPATLADITRLSNGGFVLCSSSTANTVRTYNAAGAVQATATSASPLPTLGALASTSCLEDPQGRIAVAYSGGTDAVRLYSADLSTVIWTFTDTNVLTTPGKLAVRSNGNILVLDTAFNHIVEINPNGTLVRVIGGTVLATPNNIMVVP